MKGVAALAGRQDFFGEVGSRAWGSFKSSTSSDPYPLTLPQTFALLTFDDFFELLTSSFYLT